MTKSEFRKSLRERFNREFVRRSEVDKELHLRKGTAARLLADTPYFGSEGRPVYHIDEVAEALWETRSL